MTTELYHRPPGVQRVLEVDGNAEAVTYSRHSTSGYFATVPELPLWG